MGLSSLHVCMDSSDHWLQGTIQEESGIDSCSPSADTLTCSRPMIENNLKPQHDQAPKCPRCDSTHTKFCYYNNYSLTQLKYFCKTCRRYWTKGGTLRNIPVGGGCRKNKKISSKKPNSQTATNQNQAQQAVVPSYHHNHPKDLQLPFPADVKLSHLNNLLGANIAGALGNRNFMESKYNNMGMVENPRPSDFMDSNMEGIVTSSRNFVFSGYSDHMGVGFGDENGYNGLPTNYQGLCFGGMSLDGNDSTTYNLMSTCQRLMLPYDTVDTNQDGSVDDMKPNPKLLSLEWQDQGCFGYPNSPGSWTGVMNGYGSSTTNPLV